MSSETAWRRRWKPTLSSKPWQPLSGVKGKYYMKCLFSNNSYEILISDMSMTYFESLAEESVKKRTKKLNPSVEAPLGRLLDHIKDNLTSEGNRKDSSAVSIKANDDKMLITLETKLAGLPFVWKFQALPCPTEMVAEQLTVPLMGMVGELLRRQAELIKLLHAKDKEIDDYKNQGAKVTRKHLQTAAFDETAFCDNMNTSKGLETQVQNMGSYAFSAEGQSLYETMMVKHAYLNREDDEDVAGESLVDDTAKTSPKKTQGHSWANRVPGSLVPSGATAESPSKSPYKSPKKEHITPDTSPVKDAELIRRQALEKRLLEEEGKQEDKQKKKKKKLKL